MRGQKVKEKPMRVGRTAEWWTSPNCDLAVDFDTNKGRSFYWSHQFLQSPISSSRQTQVGANKVGK